MTTKYKSKFTGEQIDNSVETVVSNTATNGQVLTANGTGGATWQDASGGGTEVIANPTLAGTESDLTGLEVAGTKYKVPTGGGTEVVANPTGEATEELTKLQVGSSVYSIPSGGSGGGTQLYLHTIVTDNYTFYIVTNGADAFNPTDDIKKNALLNSIVYNKWIGTGGFNNKFVFGMSIGVKKGSIPPTYHTSPTAYQKGNALSYYDTNGSEVTISRENFGSFVSDTVASL